MKKLVLTHIIVSKMTMITTLIATLLVSLNSLAAVECTQDDKSKWMDQTKFQADLKTEGYQIKVFKITKGNCYEIYGKNKDGKKVEIYFHPVTGKIIKEKIN